MLPDYAQNSPDEAAGSNKGERHPLGEATLRAGEAADRRQDGASVPKGTVGQQETGVEEGGVGEIWGADVTDAASAKVRSSSLIEILARTQRSWRAAL